MRVIYDRSLQSQPILAQVQKKIIHKIISLHRRFTIHSVFAMRMRNQNRARLADSTEMKEIDHKIDLIWLIHYY